MICPVCGFAIDGPPEPIGVNRTTDAHPGCASDWWATYAEDAA